MGQAVRCKTLLGLRQQLCTGLLLQMILAVKLRTWSQCSAFSLPGRVFSLAQEQIFPTAGQGYFMLM